MRIFFNHGSSIINKSSMKERKAERTVGKKCFVRNQEMEKGSVREVSLMVVIVEDEIDFDSFCKKS